MKVVSTATSGESKMVANSGAEWGGAWVDA